MLAAELAKEARTPILLDLDYRPKVWPSSKRSVCTFARWRRCPTSRWYRGGAAGGDRRIRSIARGDELFGGHLELFILKRGGEGCRVYRRDGATSDVPPFKIEVLNVLGAGDAFASGFIYGHLRGWPAARAGRFGNAVGAIVVTRHGCANFMPSLAEVHSFMAEHGEPAAADLA